MPETEFRPLSASDQREVLLVAEGASGRRANVLEKDVWVVEVLRILFSTAYGDDLTFKGGTSLSKAYGAISRFSEDVDVTYNIRSIVPDLVPSEGLDPIPPSRSQAGRWTERTRSLLAAWVKDEVAPAIETQLEDAGLPASLQTEGDSLIVAYTPLLGGYDFVQPRVLVEFGARATGEPREEHAIECDAAGHVPGIVFPTARPHVMLAERTFWEKATAVHVFCLRPPSTGNRLSRHWHDLVRLADAGYAERAMADRALAIAVARHKSMFFRTNDAGGRVIDYFAAVNGGLQLVPGAEFQRTLEDDYGRMVSAGMLLDDDEDFEHLMQRCLEIQEWANSIAAG